MFGAPATAPAGGSLFGGAQATSNAGTNLFGAKPAAPSTGFFGGAPAASNSGTGFFGGAPAASSMGTGLFGSAPVTSTAGTGLFGASTANAPSAGGLFGAPATSTAPGMGGGFFGSMPSTAPQTGGLFGAPAAATGYMVGAPSNTLGTGSFFGAKPTTSAAAPFSFGASTMTPATGGMFGSAPKPFGSINTGFGNAKPQIPVWQNLMYIKNAWDPTHPNCQFRHYFYNFVHPDDVNKYGPPPNVDPYEWQQALLECPDRECMVPALAIGFEDLKKRMESQNDMTEMQRIKLDEIEVKMNEIMQFHLLQTAAKVREFKRRHIQLSQRVLTLMKRVQILRNRGVPIRADEEVLRVRLENALEQLRNPAHFRGKITELWAQIQILKDSKRLHPTGNYEVADETQLETIGKFLQDQQAGLQHVTAVIQQDMQDIEILQRKLEEIGSSTRA
ncbi:hypothetical protein BGZ65_010287 [Modicella reniformis]|uniref:Nucleoporin Nup54 alpha-helical domain-containing protein n=1 Tax=Modicella reniformis TaxID=1440133 RepID=A0A9P6MAQ5_9FUNG|nr:hypothetical protein BGZ65_010287 [Modicella reniformis]